METPPRHQCLIYEGPPSRHLPALAALICEKLKQNYRCLYLNSRPMVAGMRSCLAAAGTDVFCEIAKGSLALSTERQEPADRGFDIDRMIRMLEDAVGNALKDGYLGLWASGDMTWEFGSGHDFSRLLDYEWRLEKLFHRQPALSGICQYHADTLPPEATRKGLVAHPSIFINETLSLINPHYVPRESFSPKSLQNGDLDSAVARLWKRPVN